MIPVSADDIALFDNVVGVLMSMRDTGKRGGLDAALADCGSVTRAEFNTLRLRIADAFPDKNRAYCRLIMTVPRGPRKEVRTPEMLAEVAALHMAAHEELTDEEETEEVEEDSPEDERVILSNILRCLAPLDATACARVLASAAVMKQVKGAFFLMQMAGGKELANV